MKRGTIFRIGAVLILSALLVPTVIFTRGSSTQENLLPAETSPVETSLFDSELPYGGRVITNEMPNISWNTAGSFDGSLILDFRHSEIEPFALQINSVTGELEWYYRLEETGSQVVDTQRLLDDNIYSVE